MGGRQKEPEKTVYGGGGKETDGEKNERKGPGTPLRKSLVLAALGGPADHRKIDLNGKRVTGHDWERVETEKLSKTG